MIIRQPNGKYLIYKYDKGIEINKSEEDILNIYIKKAIESAKEQAEKDIKEAKGLNYILKREIEFNNIIITEQDLKDMGINILKTELIKKVRLKPQNRQYIECNFEIIAECPNCKSRVINGIGFANKQCNKCGQMIDWGN